MANSMNPSDNIPMDPALVERPILKRRTSKGSAAHGDRADLSSLFFEALHRAYGTPKKVRVAIEHLM